MKNVKIPFKKELKFDNKPSLLINDYKWVSNNYKPLTEVFLCYNNDAVKVRITAYESELRCEAKDDDGRVWCDSCVEFFFKPFACDDRYINFEINPVGSMIMSIGDKRQDRLSIVNEYKSKLELTAKIENDFWTVEFQIPFNMLHEIYGLSIESIGNIMQGNFYKCGDETAFPHYGMWNEVLTKKPDFHRPEYFGELILQ